MAYKSVQIFRHKSPVKVNPLPAADLAPAATAVMRAKAPPTQPATQTVKIEKEPELSLVDELTKIDLGTAGSKEIKTRGNVIWVKGDTTTTQNSTLFVQFDDPNGPKIPFKYGESMRGKVFNKLFISWSAQAGEALYIYITYDPRISSFYPY